MQDLFGRQVRIAFLPLRLLGSPLPQEGWCVRRHLPVDEGWTGTTDLGKGSEASACPEGASPQTVQFFDFAIVLGLSNGQEDQFDAQIQTQPHELPEDAGCFVAPQNAASLSSCKKCGIPRDFHAWRACARTVSKRLLVAMVCVQARVCKFKV